MVVVGDAPVDAGLDHVVAEPADQKGERGLALEGIERLTLEEVRATVQDPAGLTLRGAVTRAAGLAHARRDLILEVEHVADVERRERGDAGQSVQVVDVVEVTSIAWRTLVDLVMPAESHVQEQLLLHEAAVELARDIVGRGVGQEVVAVEGLARPRGQREWSTGRESPRLTDRERRVAAASRRRARDCETHPVVRADEVGQLADELDRLLVREPALLAVGDERVGLVAVGVHLTGVLDVELPGVRVPGEARLDAGKEPEPVLDDVAAERRSKIADVEEVALAPDDRAGGGHRLRA